MAILKCKMCGGDIELSADKTFGTCEYCGSTMTFPKVDDEQRAAMFNRGNHFRRTGEFDKALAVYERIVQEDEDDAEAHWCCALCRFGIEYVEDPNTLEYLPTCHRASFDSFLEDVDYLAALEHSDGITRRQYQKDAAKIAEVQRGILATSQNEEPFDVFLCYKETEDDGSRTRDSLYAQDIYYQLTEQGRRVFFSRITLEDKAGTEYEPYIFAALNSAKVMVLVTTSAEHANAVWVKNEWSRFLSLMRKDRSKLLLPCYRDMDPYDLPEALSVLQSYDMSKIGFIQDLIRGVNKVLNAAKPKAQVAKETMVLSSAANPTVTPLLDRAFLALEDGEWDRADEFCEQVLNLDARNAEAYLGKLMVELQVRRWEQLKDQPQPFDGNKTFQKVIRFGSEKLKAELAGVTAYIQERNETARQKGVYQQALAIMSERSEQGYRKAAELFASVPDYGDARAKVDECIEKAETTRREGIYQQASALMREDTEPSCRKAAELFAAIPDHSDAAKQREICLQRAETIRQDGVYQRALQLMGKGTAEGYREAAKLLSAIPDYRDAQQQIAACAAGTEDLRQEQIYEKAVDLARGDTEDGYQKAAELFASIPEHRDARDRSLKCREKAESIRKEQVYRNAVKLASYRSMAELEEAARLFGTVSGYKDADKQLFICQNKIQDLLAKEEARRLKRHQKEQQVRADEEHRKNRKPNWTPLVVGLIAVALIAVAVVVVLPGIRAKKEVDVEQPVPMEAASTPEAADAPIITATPTTAPTQEPGINYSNPKYPKEFWDQHAVRNTIAAGEAMTVALRVDGSVRPTGVNDHGQYNVRDWKDIVSVATSGYHTVGLKADGTVVAVGYNGNGQCDVDGWADIVAIAAGGDHTVGLKTDGTVVAVGWNASGQCNVSEWTDIVAIVAGDAHTAGLKADGTAVAVGWNRYGECDVDGWADIVAIAAGGSHTVGLKADGTVVAVGSGRDGICDVSAWTDIVTIAAGEFHTVGLKADGTVVAVGANNWGQCDVSDWTNIVAIAAGSQHTVGLKADGTVAAVGRKDDGQCNVYAWTDIRLPEKQQAAPKPTQTAGIIYSNPKYPKEFWDQHAVQNTIAISDSMVIAIKNDGTLVTNSKSMQSSISGWTNRISVATSGSITAAVKEDGTVLFAEDTLRLTQYFKKWKDFVAVSVGPNHAVCLRAAGTVVAGGDNSFGQCNVSEWKDIVAVAAGGSHTVGLMSDGTVVAVGATGSGQCDVFSWTDIVAIAAGDQHTVGLKADGTVEAVGNNRYGKCDVSGWQNIIAIAAGKDQTVGLKADGTVVITDSRQRGINKWLDIVAIAAGGSRTMGLKADGTVLAVGDFSNDYISDWTDIRVPEKQQAAPKPTQTAGIIYSNPKYPKEFWDQHAVHSAIAASNHTVAIKTDGTVVATGSNDHGQCNVSGWKDIVEVAVGWGHTVGLRANGTVVATEFTGDQTDNRGQCEISDWTNIVSIAANASNTFGVKADGTVIVAGRSIPAVSGWTDITAVAASEYHVMGLKADGSVVAYGNVGNVSGWKNIVSIAAGRSHIVGLRADGFVVAAGSNEHGECDVSGWTDITAISATGFYTIGLKKDGTVVIAGSEEMKTKLDVSQWKDIVAVAAGQSHVVGLKANGTMVAVGSNANGKLDVSNWTDIKLPEKIDGAAKINEVKQKLSATEVGSVVFFGSYEQDNVASNGKEAIEWIILAKEGNRALLISRFALDCQRYNFYFADITWETSSLRKWLNGTFLNAAFSSAEQNSIVSSTVTADKNPSYSTSPGNDTTDKVFLLSITEAYKYFNSDEARKCAPTDNVKAKGAFIASNGNCYWWLRSPGYRSDHASYVISDGSVYNYGINVDESDGAVRPALWIDLGS